MSHSSPRKGHSWPSKPDPASLCLGGGACLSSCPAPGTQGGEEWAGLQSSPSLCENTSKSPSATLRSLEEASNLSNRRQLFPPADLAPPPRTLTENDMMEDGPLLSATKARRPTTDLSLQKPSNPPSGEFLVASHKQHTRPASTNGSLEEKNPATPPCTAQAPKPKDVCTGSLQICRKE